MNAFILIAGCVVTAMVGTAMLLIGKAETRFVQEPVGRVAATGTTTDIDLVGKPG